MGKWWYPKTKQELLRWFSNKYPLAPVSNWRRMSKKQLMDLYLEERYKLDKHKEYERKVAGNGIEVVQR